ncbi:hypothetical protein [Cohnella fermenti]|uniref:Uncharacterized protein n=1 Tax=Cohnella fermenti TaxID=2565925 RepID=A0A4S4C638_9BACL|nr:hypothetical protein [Cohnella fermenti]THF82708.1 hypothetical protein E6C55_06480 [Cohnella fermenti]
MDDNNLEQIENDISVLIKQIIFDIRPQKIINPDTFRILYERLDEYKNKIHDSKVLSRSMAGKLFYLYSSMVLEAKYDSYSDRFMNELSKLRISLLHIYDEDMLA